MFVLTYIWLLLDVLAQKLFAFRVIQDDNLDPPSLEQVFTTYQVCVFPNHDAGYLVEQDGARAHHAWTVQT